MTVQVIQARSKQNTQTDTKTPARLRVAAYCRVSTDSEEQESSYEAQCSHYSAYIRANPAWELVGIYADEGITGTSTRRREQFKRMVRDCEAGKVDLVVTKSISRFARNTLDCLQYIRRLKALGIAVYFEKENINTLDAKGEVLITIMASIAQQESASISQNVRMGIQYRMQEGKGRLNTVFFLGLQKDERSGALVAVPGEADVVRRIYREYLEGFSPAAIGRRLDADGTPTPAGGRQWYASTVSSILQNEKYCGDLLLQKWYTPDFLHRRVVRNTGQLPQYYVEDDHEPVVPKEVFFQVQGEMARRAGMVGNDCGPRRASDDALYGRLVCGHCGRVLKRYEDPQGHVDWRCRVRAYRKRSAVREEKGACPCRVVEPDDARRAIVEAFNLLPSRRGSLGALRKGLREGEIAVFDAQMGELRERRARLSERKHALEKELDASGAQPDSPDGVVQELRAVEEALTQLDEERERLALLRAESAAAELRVRVLLELADTMEHARGGMQPAGEAAEQPAWCADTDEFFNRTRYIPPEGVLGDDGRMARYDDSMAARFIRHIVVEDDAFTVCFKADLRVRIPVMSH